MKTFLLNSVNNIFKRKSEKYLKQFFKFILRKEHIENIQTDDVVLYPLSTLCIYLTHLDDAVASSFGPFEGPNVTPEPGENQHLIYKYGMNSKARESQPPPDELKQFLLISKAHTSTFFEAYMKHFLFSKRHEAKLNLRSCTYLLNALCLLNYEDHKNHRKWLFERLMKEFIYGYHAYLRKIGTKHQLDQVQNSQMGNLTNNFLNCQILVESLTVINKHISKLKTYDLKNVHLFHVFYLNVINYLFACETFHTSGELPQEFCAKHRTGESEQPPCVVLTNHIDEKCVNINRIKQFYQLVLLDMHNFFSIALFLKKYEESVYHLDFYCAQESTVSSDGSSPEQGCSGSDPIRGDPVRSDPIRGDYIRAMINRTIVHIYLNLFYGTPSGREDQRGEGHKSLHCDEGNTTKRCNWRTNSSVTKELHINNKHTHSRKKKFMNEKSALLSHDLAEARKKNPRMEILNMSASYLLQMWNNFYDEFDQLYKGGKININFVIFQNGMNMVRFLNTLSFSILSTDIHACDHFNKNLYNHMSNFKLFIKLKKTSTDTSILNAAIYTYIQLFLFILNFYISLVCTNTLVSLLSCFSQIGLTHTKEGKRTIRCSILPIRLINEEIISRSYECVVDLHKGHPYERKKLLLLHPMSSIHGISPTSTSVNRRHLFNLCNIYGKLNFYHVSFVELIENVIITELPHLDKKDILALIYFLNRMFSLTTRKTNSTTHNQTNSQSRSGSPSLTQGLRLRHDVLLHLLRNIEPNIIRFQMSEIHLILKTLLSFSRKYTDPDLFLSTFADTLLHHVVLRTLVMWSVRQSYEKFHVEKSQVEIESYAKGTPSSMHGKERVDRTDFKKTIQEFSKMIRLSRSSNKTYLKKTGDVLQVHEGNSSFSIKENEMFNIYSSLLETDRRITTPILNTLMRDFVNILSVVTKLNMKKYIPLFDVLYLFIARIPNCRNVLNTHEWVSLILSHCKVKHTPYYVNQYLQLLHENILNIPASTFANTDNPVEELHPSEGRTHVKEQNESEKNIHLIRTLSHRLKNTGLKNKELICRLAQRTRDR
ncbi:hypothetical protein, conserved [Plasmodium gonderi]|uniref:Uncharacterized protein n=1 Tax=Plasmodium gonderi TaxID=77519 RepID=A0A1Y1JHZ0_PLAGO|nr:hypothetical protein, conserved [Plasmodium gonderi]GAW80392.1 hypothetical protein, conserved [Plasmodium gonderi]